MIVGTRLLSGKIAHFQIETGDYKNARNEVMWELGVECGIHTPILASIPDCGRDYKVRVEGHRVPARGGDPLQGALDVVTGMGDGVKE